MVALQAALVLLAVATAHAQTALPIKAIGPTLVEIKVGDGQATFELAACATDTAEDASDWPAAYVRKI